MQSSIAIFRSMPALANIIVGGVTLVATMGIEPHMYRPMYGHVTFTYLGTVAMFAYNPLIAPKESNLWSTWNFFMFMIFINRIETRAREQDQFGAVEGYARAA